MASAEPRECYFLDFRENASLVQAAVQAILPTEMWGQHIGGSQGGSVCGSVCVDPLSPTATAMMYPEGHAGSLLE